MSTQWYFCKKKKIDKCVVYEHVRLAREGMHAAEECTLFDGESIQEQSATNCRGRSVRQRPGVVTSAGHSSLTWTLPPQTQPYLSPLKQSLTGQAGANYYSHGEKVF